MLDHWHPVLYAQNAVYKGGSRRPCQESQGSELRFARGTKVNKNFCTCIASERQNKGNCWTDLAMADTDEAECLNAFLVSVFTKCSLGWSPSLGIGLGNDIQEEGRPEVAHDWLNPYTSMRSTGCVQMGWENCPRSQPGLCHLWKVTEIRVCSQWLETASTAVFEKSQKVDLRLVRLPLVPEKVEEWVHSDHIF